MTDDEAAQLRVALYHEAREYMRKRGIQSSGWDETSVVRHQFAEWYMKSGYSDPAPAWSFYQQQVLGREV